MRGHLCTASRVDTECETDSDSETMRCISCKEYYSRCDAGTCKECYEEASDTEEELKREIEDLKAKVAFLRFWSPLDLHITHRSPAGPCFTDVVLIASSDDGLIGTPSVPVPAHKAVLVNTQFLNPISQTSWSVRRLAFFNWVILNVVYCKFSVDQSFSVSWLINDHAYTHSCCWGGACFYYCKDVGKSV